MLGLAAAAASAVLVVTAGSVVPAGGAEPVAGAATPHIVTAGGGAVADPRVERNKSYRAPNGPFFNNPRAGWRSKLAIERQIVKAIDAARRKSYIRIALYSFDRVNVARALLDARRRGVRVQILLNDHQDTRAMKMLRARLGTNRNKQSFIYKCRSSCRGDKRKRHLHTKFYTFTRAGKSDHVLMVGSANLTLNAVKHQWNDLYITSGNEPLFDQFVALFDDMKKDYSKQQPSYGFCGIPVGRACDESIDKYTALVFPRRVGRGNDVVLDILRRIQCRTPKAGGGFRRTKLVLSMHTMRGNRGNYLAAAIRRKYAEGCNFRVQFGLIGFHTKGILGRPTSRGRIPLRSTGFDFHPGDNKDKNGDGDDDLVLDRYTHQKYFVIRGNYNGNPNTYLTFTGSSNWASLGKANDEVLFSIRGRNVARSYLRNFNLMWRPGNSRNAYTTTYLNFRLLAGDTWEND